MFVFLLIFSFFSQSLYASSKTGTIERDIKDIKNACCICLYQDDSPGDPFNFFKNKCRNWRDLNWKESRCANPIAETIYNVDRFTLATLPRCNTALVYYAGHGNPKETLSNYFGHITDISEESGATKIHFDTDSCATVANTVAVSAFVDKMQNAFPYMTLDLIGNSTVASDTVKTEYKISLSPTTPPLSPRYNHKKQLYFRELLAVQSNPIMTRSRCNIATKSCHYGSYDETTKKIVPYSWLERDWYCEASRDPMRSEIKRQTCCKNSNPKSIDSSDTSTKNQVSGYWSLPLDLDKDPSLACPKKSLSLPIFW